MHPSSKYSSATFGKYLQLKIYKSRNFPSVSFFANTGNVVECKESFLLHLTPNKRENRIRDFRIRSRVSFNNLECPYHCLSDRRLLSSFLMPAIIISTSSGSSKQFGTISGLTLISLASNIMRSRFSNFNNVGIMIQPWPPTYCISSLHLTTLRAFRFISDCVIRFRLETHRRYPLRFPGCLVSPKPRVSKTWYRRWSRLLRYITDRRNWNLNAWKVINKRGLT